MQAADGAPSAEGARGPRDDFFCIKYQVWYRLDDCVYRGVHKTFPGCVSCFQGHLNIRSRETGSRPLAMTAPRQRPAGASAAVFVEDLAVRTVAGAGTDMDLDVPVNAPLSRINHDR